MRTIFASILVVFSFVALRALAGDVAYQLETARFTTHEESQELQPTAIELRDRVWAVPGIEESQEPLEPVRTFDFLTARRFRIDGDGPEWLDGAVWPRTRELFHRNDNVFFARAVTFASVHEIPLCR